MVERRVLGPGDGELYEPPGGLEELFRWMNRHTEEIDPATLDAAGATYGCATDMAATIVLVERHVLVF